MDWSKTLRKLGWFEVASLLGWAGMFLISTEARDLAGNNPTVLAVFNLLGGAVVAARDWWKHREPKDPVA